MTTTVINMRSPKRGSAIYVGRPSPAGNPYRVDIDGDRATCLALYAYLLLKNPERTQALLNALRGRVLGCWCAKKEPCHGQILAALADDIWPEDWNPKKRESEKHYVTRLIQSPNWPSDLMVLVPK